MTTCSCQLCKLPNENVKKKIISQWHKFALIEMQSSLLILCHSPSFHRYYDLRELKMKPNNIFPHTKVLEKFFVEYPPKWTYFQTCYSLCNKYFTKHRMSYNPERFWQQGKYLGVDNLQLHSVIIRPLNMNIHLSFKTVEAFKSIIIQIKRMESNNLLYINFLLTFSEFNSAQSVTKQVLRKGSQEQKWARKRRLLENRPCICWHVCGWCV